MEAETFMGLPVIVSEEPPPGHVMVIRERRNGESQQTVIMHPTLAYAFRLVTKDLDRRVADPSVMIQASIQWQAEVIERNASRAVGRLALLSLQQDQRRLQRVRDQEVARRLRNAREFIHRGRQHRWTRNRMRRTATCHGCGLAITEESAERLGVELGNDYGDQRPSLSIMVDGEWHEVKGIRNLSFNREDGAR